MRELKIGKKEAGQRMDKYLKKYFREAGSGFLYKMLRKKNIVLNDKKAEGKEVLQEGDSIKLYLAEETIDKFRGQEKKVPVIKKNFQKQLDIVYEDENFLIINKPAGILSQKAAASDVSMVEWIVSYLMEKGELTKQELQTFRPSVCNRLDRNTSGLILAGKTLVGLQAFSDLLKNRNMKKYYLCLVKGNVKKSSHCKAYLVKDKKNNQVKIYQQPIDQGEYIETAYEPLWNGKTETLLKVELITGKSHQIRSHLASLGYPLAGDAKYGNVGWNKELRDKAGLNHQFLHAWRIEFPELEGSLQPLSKRQVQADLPGTLLKVLEYVNADVSKCKLYQE